MTKDQMRIAVGVLEQAMEALAPFADLAYTKGAGKKRHAQFVTLTFGTSQFDDSLRARDMLTALKNTLESQLNEESAA